MCKMLTNFLDDISILSTYFIYENDDAFMEFYIRLCNRLEEMKMCINESYYYYCRGKLLEIKLMFDIKYC